MTEFRPIKRRWKSRLLLGSWLKSLLKRLQSLHWSSFLLAQYGCGGWIAATILGHKAQATCWQCWGDKTGARVLGGLASWNCSPTLDYLFFFFFTCLGFLPYTAKPNPNMQTFQSLWKGPQGRSPASRAVTSPLSDTQQFQAVLKIDAKKSFQLKGRGSWAASLRRGAPRKTGAGFALNYVVCNQV